MEAQGSLDKYMEAKRGHELIQLRHDHEIDITRRNRHNKKASNSCEVTTDDVAEGDLNLRNLLGSASRTSSLTH